MELFSKKFKIAIILSGAVLLILFAAVLFYVVKPSSSNPTAKSGEPQRKVVTISNYQFSPHAVVVRYGDTVAWRNTSDQLHTVTFRTLSKTLKPGETWELVITPDYFLKGNTMYWCDFHAQQGMQGARVIVE